VEPLIINEARELLQEDAFPFPAMKIKILSAILALTPFLSFPATAETVKVPNDDFAIASIAFPDDWESEAIDKGVAAQSPDTAVYMAVVAVGSEKGMKSEIDDTFDFLKEHNVVLDTSSKHEDTFKVAGFEAKEITFQGKDEDGPAAVSIAFVPIKDKVLVLTYWVSTKEEAKHQKEVGKILNSLKQVE
jgi:hypothetical protein